MSQTLFDFAINVSLLKITNGGNQESFIVIGDISEVHARKEESRIALRMVHGEEVIVNFDDANLINKALANIIQSIALWRCVYSQNFAGSYVDVTTHNDKKMMVASRF